MTTPDEPFGKIGGDGEERRIRMRGKAFTVIVALLLITLAVAPAVSAASVDTGCTRYTFTAESREPLNKYSFVSYWLTSKPSYQIRTPITATTPYYTWTITVPGRWGGRQVSYQVCTMDAPYKWTRMDCGKVQTVQLGRYR